LVSESHVGNSDNLILAFGIRFVSKKSHIDIGLINYFDDFDSFTLPWFSFSVYRK